MTSEVAHKFIVVEGPIGVGKTSLARRLCESLSAQGVFEQAAQNPFLERFYRNPRAGALPAQLYFLLQRAQQLASLNQAQWQGDAHREVLFPEKSSFRRAGRARRRACHRAAPS